VQQGATDFAKNCEDFALFLIPEISGIAQKYARNPLTMRISTNIAQQPCCTFVAPLLHLCCTFLLHLPVAPSCCASCTQKQHPVQHVEDGGFVVFG
jgi:hypothetical protein